MNTIAHNLLHLDPVPAGVGIDRDPTVAVDVIIVVIVRTEVRALRH